MERHGSHDVTCIRLTHILYICFICVISVLIMFRGGRGLEAYRKSQRNGNGVPITHPPLRTLQRNRPPVASTHTYGSKCVCTYERCRRTIDMQSAAVAAVYIYITPTAEEFFFLDV